MPPMISVGLCFVASILRLIHAVHTEKEALEELIQNRTARSEKTWEARGEKLLSVLLEVDKI
jgi:hypothetical protein